MTSHATHIPNTILIGTTTIAVRTVNQTACRVAGCGICDEIDGDTLSESIGENHRIGTPMNRTDSKTAETISNHCDSRDGLMPCRRDGWTYGRGDNEISCGLHIASCQA